MLHWARSYSVIAVIAGAAALAAPVSPLTPVATLLTALFAALAVMALLTGVLGRTRDGAYSVDRTLIVLFAAAALVWLGHEWIANRWTTPSAQHWAATP